MKKKSIYSIIVLALLGVLTYTGIFIFKKPVQVEKPQEKPSVSVPMEKPKEEPKEEPKPVEPPVQKPKPEPEKPKPAPKPNLKPANPNIKTPTIRKPNNVSDTAWKCMTDENDVTFNEIVQADYNSVMAQIKKYEVNVYYHNLVDNKKVLYKENVSHYAASTVKPAVALYYYELAAKGEINLEKKYKFTKKYWDRSVRKRIELDSNISLRTLVEYSMIYSDNGAHRLLVDIIGFDKLNEYVNNKMGVGNRFFPNTYFGNITAKEGNILVNELYKFIDENGKLGQEMKGYMLDAILNTLKIKGVPAAHKYGWWKKDFHEIGIIYDEYPYTIVILSKYGENEAFKKEVKNLHTKIYEYHATYIAKKKAYCGI